MLRLSDQHWCLKSSLILKHAEHSTLFCVQCPRYHMYFGTVGTVVNFILKQCVYPKPQNSGRHQVGRLTCVIFLKQHRTYRYNMVVFAHANVISSSCWQYKTWILGWFVPSQQCSEMFSNQQSTILFDHAQTILLTTLLLASHAILQHPAQNQVDASFWHIRLSS